MNLQEFRDQLPEYAKDTKVNLGNILSVDGAPGLSEKQIWGIALSCAYALQSRDLAAAIQTEASAVLGDEELFAAKAAASIMAMNNVYYRFTHLAEDGELSKLPARLRMTIIGRPGVDKVDFELYSLAVSAINGCGACIQSHIEEVKKGGVSLEGAQSAARIAAVLAAAKQSMFTL